MYADRTIYNDQAISVRMSCNDIVNGKTGLVVPS